MNQRDLIASAKRHLTQNYKQAPIVMSRGEGSMLWDVDGNRYLDMTAGIAVCCLGHAHPAVTAAISAQASKLVHVSNLYYVEKQIQLAEALSQRAFGGRVFFCNSGGEANEAALKLARRYQQVVAKAPHRTAFISTIDSFHGRTFATLAVTGQEKYRKHLGSLVEPVRFVPYGDLAAMERVVSDACAVILEPIQAEGGIIVPPTDYLRAVRELCTRNGTLLIFDEVQTGVGRTGTWFAHQQENCTPDIMSLAKGLAGGVPIGAIVANEEAAKGFVPLEGEPATHASTFGGNPLACAAALAVIETIEKEALIEHCKKMGELLGAGLQRLVEKYPAVALEARGRGLLRGLAVAKDAPGLTARCREKRLLLSIAGTSTLRFVPALTIKREHIEDALTIVDAVLGSAAL